MGPDWFHSLVSIPLSTRLGSGTASPVPNHTPAMKRSTAERLIVVGAAAHSSYDQDCNNRRQREHHLPQVLVVACARPETSACADGHLVWLPRGYCSAAAREACDSRRTGLVGFQFLFASGDAGRLDILPRRSTTRSTV